MMPGAEQSREQGRASVTEAGLYRRTVSRIENKVQLGPDAQVDDKAMVFAPTDPARTDPFLLLSEDRFSKPGFEWHPHRGLETVTMVLGGVLEHGDSLGHAGALEQGDVQWMTAGHGIIHRELAFRDEYAHTLQLWLNLPASRKLVPTQYQDLRHDDQAVYDEPGVRVRVISGTSGPATGPAANQEPILGVRLLLDPGAAYTQFMPAGFRAFGHVLDGRVTIGGREVRAGQTAWSDPVGTGDAASGLEMQASDGDGQATVLLFAGQPLGEPVVMAGPFVMNSQAEIMQAHRDLQAGKFGDTPRQARLLTH
jgi:redox-sensitive bicupin YhaK (pirin superfamily)